MHDPALTHNGQEYILSLDRSLSTKSTNTSSRSSNRSLSRRPAATLTTMHYQNREWRRTVAGMEYVLSTDRQILDEAFVAKMLGAHDTYWAQPLAATDLTRMLDNCLNLSLYQSEPSFPPPKTVSEPSSPREGSPTLEDPSAEVKTQIGYARLITDAVTFAYLTDVYIVDDKRAAGLGRFIMEAVKEIVNDMPGLRRMLLLTSSPKSMKWYKEVFGMHDIHDETEESGLVAMSTKMAQKIP